MNLTHQELSLFFDNCFYESACLNFEMTVLTMGFCRES